MRAVAAATLVGLTISVPVSALAAGPADTPPATTGSPTGQVNQDPTPLTPAQLQEQLKQAAKLQDQLAAANAKMAQIGKQLADLSLASQKAMAQVVAARAAEAQAKAEENRQLAILRSLSMEAQQAKQDVNDMAYDAYVNGAGSLNDMATILDLVTSGGAESQGAATVDYLSKGRQDEQKRFTSLAQAQQVTAARAVAARQAREAATAKAVAAQETVARAIAAQQAMLAQYQEAAAGSAAELKALGISAELDPGTLRDLVQVPLCSNDTGTYRNGFLPATALCPIDGAPGHMMRPAAARAMNAMRKAYLKAFGSPLCITDTYRSYAAQVDVKRRKPGLAATPGTSNHGWGLAADLCGGIQSFGTPQFLWMKQNAPLFGFYHPAWAEPTGSKPEPWHWEYVH